MVLVQAVGDKTLGYMKNLHFLITEMNNVITNININVFQENKQNIPRVLKISFLLKWVRKVPVINLA